MIKIKRGTLKYLISLTALLLICILYAGDVFESLEQKTIDWRFMRNQQKGDSRSVAVVEITGDCLREISSWPIKRSVIAAAIEKLMAAGVKTLAIDILFADRTTPAEDDALKAVIKKYGDRIIFAAQMVESFSASGGRGETKKTSSLITPHESFGVVKERYGLINIEYLGLNKDGAVRNVNLFTESDGGRMELLSLAGALDYLGRGGALDAPRKFLHASDSPFFINYYRPYHDSYFTKLVFSTLLSQDTDETAGLVSGKLVFLGVSAPAVPDMRLTPFGVMPGVEIHASVAANIIENNYASRAGKYFNFGVLFFLCIAMHFYFQKIRAAYDIAVICAVYTFYAGAAWILVIKYRLFIDLLPPLALLIMHAIFFRFYQNVRQIYISNLELQRMLDRMGGLYKIARLSQELTGLQELLNITVVEMSKILKCKRISIVIEDPKSKFLILKAAIGFGNEDRPIENLVLDRKSPVVSKVIETSTPVLVKNVDEHDGLKAGESVNYKTKSFVCVPIIITGHAVGALSLTDKENQENFTDDDLKAIVVFAGQISSNIEHLFSIETQMERRRLDKELEIASGMQKKLVPSGIKNIARYEIFGSYIPAKEVSGDYYDCIELDEKHLLLLVGDVSGKGVPAGLFMMTARTFLHTIIKYERDLSRIMGFLNNYLTDNSESTAYLTVFMSVLNIETGALEYVNGGHLSPYILKKNKTLESLETKNLICGMFNDVVYDVGVTTIEPGDALFIFTDGITEAQAADESMYGDESLKTVIKSLDATQSASEQVGRILKSVKDFVKDAPQSDDITILSVKALE
ncbi:MAG TPA: SpoIIE family protein phosphatase [Candidatus Wallbacteria bacterium]|nr:SpoIIE family protein phosphatase [Candidatus Wallbacteria bacterium]